MSTEDVLKKIKVILARELSVDESKISGDSLIAHELGADSLDFAEIAMIIKEDFSHDLTEQELSNLKSVNDLVRILSNKKVSND